MNLDARFEEVARFHGHICPGLAIGYRVSKAATKALNLSRSKDEEVVAVVENNACGTDAVQYVLGCTFGKGNLIFHDYGKHVFTIARRDTGEAVRIVVSMTRTPSQDEEAISRILARIREGRASDKDHEAWARHKLAKAGAVLEMDQDQLLTITPVKIELPDKARIADSVACDQCGEKVMETKTISKDGRLLCIPCAKSSN